MTVSTIQLADTLQALIDARLDTIDRMLMGRVPRRERRAIVGDVEAQIDEMLQERDLEDLTRVDILSILARLDPPEAYLPEAGEWESVVPARVEIPAHAPKWSARPDRDGDQRVAWASGILGLVALGVVPLLLAPFLYIAAALLESEEIMIFGLLGSAGLMFVGGVLAVVLGICSRRGRVWAVVGIVTGALAVLASMFGGLFLVLNI